MLADMKAVDAEITALREQHKIIPLRRLKALMIQHALEVTKGNKKLAAKLLDVSYNNFTRMVKGK